MKFTSFLLILIFCVTTSQSQDKFPLSYYNSINQHISWSNPLVNNKAIVAISDDDNLLQHAGTYIPVNIDIAKCFGLEDEVGSTVTRFGFFFPEGVSVGFSFDQFFLSAGQELYIYSPDYKLVQGPYNIADANKEYVVIPPMDSDSLIFEFNGPRRKRALPNLRMSDVLLMDKSISGIHTKGFGGSGDCEVNVNCSEGEQWKIQKQSVVRILLRIGTQAYWCSGAMINNTENDYTPYLLTADHCGHDASEKDLSQWIFYFNYEFDGCGNVSSEPKYQTLTGCTRVASGGNSGDNGSDFYLVLLDREVPLNYLPYFSGWDRTTNPSNRGVTIHHPDGDVKKISTYQSTLASAQWNGSGVISHWKVLWSTTPNGHGVTEGGSSGSPLFNEQGYLVGTLTGGLAACEIGEFGAGTGPDEPDFFGKFSYSWSENGADADEQLAPWLDPYGLNPVKMEGLMNTNVPIAFFTSDTSVVIGEGLDFYDLSQGSPDHWEWHFEGGTPTISNQQHPTGITYSSLGAFDVTLIASNAESADTLLIRDHVKVISKVFPVPSSGIIYIHLGKEFNNEIAFQLFDAMGRRINPIEFIQVSDVDYQLNTSGLNAGTYYLKISSNSYTEVKKLIVSQH